MQTKNQQVVSCPPCGENVGLPTKRGAYKVTSLMSPSIGPADHFLRKGGRKNGFTLIELLVVVLIIGILAAVAVPQYQKAVEKARMTEAIVIIQAIAKAQHVFLLANGRYAAHDELDLLDISVEGKTKNEINRISSQYFQYAPSGTGKRSIAKANHLPVDTIYQLEILKTEPDRIHCTSFAKATNIQRKLCEQLDQTGSL